MIEKAQKENQNLFTCMDIKTLSCNGGLCCSIHSVLTLKGVTSNVATAAQDWWTSMWLPNYANGLPLAHIPQSFLEMVLLQRPNWPRLSVVTHSDSQIQNWTSLFVPYFMYYVCHTHTCLRWVQTITTFKMCEESVKYIKLALWWADFNLCSKVNCGPK